MRLEHNETKNAILDIVDLVYEAKEALKKFQAKCEYLKGCHFDAEYLKEEIAPFEKKYLEERINISDCICSKLESIVTIENELKLSFDYNDKDLLNCLNIIKAVDGKIDMDAANNMASLFVGNIAALEILKQVFDNNSIKSDNIEKFMLQPAAEINLMSDHLSFVRGADSNVFLKECSNICRDLFAFGELLGLKFNDSEKNLGFGFNHKGEVIVL